MFKRLLFVLLCLGLIASAYWFTHYPRLSCPAVRDPSPAPAAAPSVEQMLFLWESERLPEEPNRIMADARRALLQNAPAPSAFPALVSASVLHVGGDLRGARDAAAAAAAAHPSEDAPHYRLASIYYSLAIFDAVSRSRYALTTMPNTENSRAQLDPAIRLEILEIATKQIPAYRRLLRDAGITESAAWGLGVMLTDVNRVHGDRNLNREVMSDMTRAFGTPAILPVLSLTPDRQSATLLCRVKQELSLADSLKPTPEIEATVIDRAEMAAIKKRVSGLLALVSGVSCRTDQQGANGAQAVDDLVTAAADGDMGRVRAALDAGVDIDGQNRKYGNTPLIAASANGRAALVEYLLKRGADVSSRSDYGATALVCAAQDGHAGIVQRLLSGGADVNAATQRSETALAIAAERGDLRIVDLLLARKVSVDAKRIDGATALMMASQGGHAEIVARLLEKGASANARSETGVTALMVASLKGHPRVVKLLLANGAEVNARTNSGETALSMAVRQGARDVALVLWTAGAR